MKKHDNGRVAAPFPLTAQSWGCLVTTPRQAEEAARLGAAWIVASHVGMFPQGPAAVMGMLPFADANGMVLDSGKELIAAGGGVPVLAGILAIDQFRQQGQVLRMISRLGFAGIQTFPSVGILAGGFRQLLDNASLGRELELDCIKAAAAMGLFACGVAFRKNEAAEAVRVGAGMVLIHPPLSPDDGEVEWTAASRKLVQGAIEETGGGAVVAAFVPGNGKPEAKALAAMGALCQFENVEGVGVDG